MVPFRHSIMASMIRHPLATTIVCGVCMIFFFAIHLPLCALVFVIYGVIFDGAEMGELVGELYAFASSDPERFLVALAQAVLPVGGWAVYGASCILWECFSSDAGVLAQHPAYKAIRDGAINFLRSNGVPPMRVKGYEWQYWTDNGGTSETWIQRRPIPTLAEAPITDLRPGEVRRMTQLTAERDSNAIL